MKINFRPLDIQTDWDWVSRFVECKLCQDTRGIVAERDGEIQGAVVLDSWSYTGVQVHLAAPNPMVWRHGLHKEVFEYVFETCDRLYIMGMTPADNADAVRFNKHIGFSPVYVVRDGFKAGVDLILFDVRREDCRYLERNKQKSEAA